MLIRSDDMSYKPHATLVLTLKFFVHMALGFAMLQPLLTQAAETRTDSTAPMSMLPADQPSEQPQHVNAMHTLYGNSKSIDLTDIRDPRIAGLSLAQILPVTNQIRVHPLAPMAAAPAALWSGTSAENSRMITIVG